MRYELQKTAAKHWGIEMNFTICKSPERYVIDFDKVKTLDDMKRILYGLRISFSQDNEYIDSIHDLVRLENYSVGEMD